MFEGRVNPVFSLKLKLMRTLFVLILMIVEIGSSPDRIKGGYGELVHHGLI